MSLLNIGIPGPVPLQNFNYYYIIKNNRSFDNVINWTMKMLVITD